MIDNQKMIKVQWVPGFGYTREHRLIKQGLINNPRIKLVNGEKESDFVFLFAFTSKDRYLYDEKACPPHKTILIDYVDSPNWFCSGKWLAYFKRSWVKRIDKGGYTESVPIPRPSNFHPLTMAIMDEFIIDEDMERDVVLSCTLRKVKRHFNRRKVIKLIERMDIKGNTQVGEFNRGTMFKFNAPDMRDYFRLLKRSRIVVTCNPGKWEGDHRTWEAFASGALVFIDKMLTPLVHPLVDGKHCIFYDLSDHGLRELRKKLLYFMQETDHAAEIAKVGYEFTMKYHRSSDRINEILEVIT